MPAPWDSGATTKDASACVVPGIRSQRWLVTTNAICPCVRTPALGPPVVPEVKKPPRGGRPAGAGPWGPRGRRTSRGRHARWLCPAASCPNVARQAPRSPRRRPKARLKRRSGCPSPRASPRWFGKVAVADHGRGAARLPEVGDLARRLPEVGRHPDRAQAEAGEHRLEHL